MPNSQVIVDAHEDLAYNALSHGRDLLRPVKEERANSKNPGATTSIPDLQRGNVRIVFGTLWVNPCGSQFDSTPCYSTAEQAYVQARAQLNYYRRLEKDGVISIIKNSRQLDDLLLEGDDLNKNRKIGVVILMEGADPIRKLAEVFDWFKDGVRIVGLAWGATRYAGGTKAPGPLTGEGRELLKEMERCEMILDCTHFSELSFFEALDIFKGSVIASHSNSRIYCPTDRQLSDEMIKRVTSKGGVIGTVLYNAFLDGNWSKGKPKNDITLSHVVRNMVHISEVSSGKKENLGIGSDFDGGFGYDSIPAELDTVADLHKIGDALKEKANFSDNEISNVLGGNFLRVLRKALPEEE